MGEGRILRPNQLGHSIDSAWFPQRGFSADLRVQLQILDRFHTRLVVANTFDRYQPLRLPPGDSELTFTVDQLHLAPGVYNVSLLVGDSSDFRMS